MVATKREAPIDSPVRPAAKREAPSDSPVRPAKIMKTENKVVESKISGKLSAKVSYVHLKQVFRSLFENMWINFIYT